MTILPILVAFFIGSIPIGYFIGRLHGIDIRTHGSGNIGATNIKRALGAKAGALTLILDAFKGIAGIFAGSAVYTFLLDSPLGMNHDLSSIFGVAAIYGHCFSPILQFSGGKGVATSLGVFLWVCPMPTVIAMFVFAIVVKTSRFVSLGSLSAVTANLIAVFMGAGQIYGPATKLSVVFASILITFRHAENIQRLLAGTELPYASRAVSSASSKPSGTK